MKPLRYPLQIPDFSVLSNLLDILQVFKSVKLFSEAKTFRLPYLIKKMTKAIYPASQCVIHQGDPINSIYIITKGSFTVKYSYSTHESAHFTMDNFIPIQDYTKASFSSSRAHEVKGRQSFNECERLLIYSPSDIIGDIEWELQSSTSVFSIYSNEEGSELFSCSIPIWNQFIEKFIPMMHSLTIEKMTMIKERIDSILKNKRKMLMTKQRSYHQKLADQTTVLHKINLINKKLKRDTASSPCIDEEKKQKVSCYSMKPPSKTRNRFYKSKSLYFDLIKNRQKTSNASKIVQFQKTAIKPFMTNSQFYSPPIFENDIGNSKQSNSHTMNDLFEKIRLRKFNTHNHSKSFITENSRRFSLIHNQGNDTEKNQLKRFIPGDAAMYTSQPVSVSIPEPPKAKEEVMQPMFIETQGKISLNFGSKFIKEQFAKDSSPVKVINKNHSQKILCEPSRDHMVFSTKDLLINRKKSQCFLGNQYDFFKKISKLKLVKKEKE